MGYPCIQLANTSSKGERDPILPPGKNPYAIPAPRVRGEPFLQLVNTSSEREVLVYS